MILGCGFQVSLISKLSYLSNSLIYVIYIVIYIYIYIDKIVEVIIVVIWHESHDTIHI